MKILLSNPFESINKESGYVKASLLYLKSIGFQVSNLACNGINSICNYDIDSFNQSKRISRCQTCFYKQEKISSKNHFDLVKIGNFLNPTSISHITRDIDNLFNNRNINLDILNQYNVNDYFPFLLIKENLSEFLIGNEINLKNRKHLTIIKRMMLSVVKLLFTYDKYIKQTKDISFSLIVNSSSFYSKALYAVSLKNEIKVIVYDYQDDNILITNNQNMKDYQTEFIIDNFSNRNLRDFPTELVSDISKSLTFLKIIDNQLSFEFEKINE